MSQKKEFDDIFDDDFEVTYEEDPVYDEDDFDVPVVKKSRPGRITSEEVTEEDEDWVPKKERRTVKEVDEVNSMDENMRRREAINKAMRAQRNEPAHPRRNP